MLTEYPTHPTVVSGKVSKVSKRAIIEGSLLVFYHGEWKDDGGPVRGLSFHVQSETDYALDYTRSPEGPVPGFPNGKPVCDDRMIL